MSIFKTILITLINFVTLGFISYWSGFSIVFEKKQGKHINSHIPNKKKHKNKKNDFSNTENLQHRLKELGYFTGKINGVFNLKTEQAIRNFQKDCGIEEDGVLDSTTEKRLREFKLE